MSVACDLDDDVDDCSHGSNTGSKILELILVDLLLNKMHLQMLILTVPVYVHLLYRWG